MLDAIIAINKTSSMIKLTAIAKRNNTLLRGNSIKSLRYLAANVMAHTTHTKSTANEDFDFKYLMLALRPIILPYSGCNL